MTEATFEERLEAFEARLTKTERERDEYKKLTLLLQEQVERLKVGLLGQKAHRLPKRCAAVACYSQSRARQNALTTTPAEPEPEQTVPAHTRRKAVRKPLPDTLPRVAIEILPPEVQVEGLDAFEFVGADTREVLERRPASCVVVAITYKKFVRKDRERGTATEVLCAPAVELPLERGLAGPSMLADTIVRRWQDHQPLTRLEDIYRREQLDLAKSTLCTWHEQLADLARPLVEAMFEDAYREPYLCVDATGVLVLAKDKCRNGHFWVLVAPEKHVLYGYSRNHDGLAVDHLLKGYKGYLVADAHSVYEHLYRDGDVIEVACWGHARRYFYKALDSDPDRAKVALSHIGALFRIERSIAGIRPAKTTRACVAIRAALSSTNSSSSAPPSCRACSTRRPFRLPFATRPINASRCDASSTTAAFPHTTTSAS